MASPADATSPGPEPGAVEALIAEEHAAVRTHLAHLRGLAADAAVLDEPALRERGAAVLDFLRQGLLPHAAVEEALLYPAIDGLVGAGATRTMTLDHEEIGRLVEELSTALSGRADPGGRAEIQRLLYVIEGFVGAHLWKEETAYVPLLARLDAPAYASLATGLARHAGEHAHAH